LAAHRTLRVGDCLTAWATEALVAAGDHDVGLLALHADDARALVEIGRLLLSIGFCSECIWQRHHRGGFRRHAFALGLHGG
jgi:hypothetical protein